MADAERPPSQDSSAITPRTLTVVGAIVGAVVLIAFVRSGRTLDPESPSVPSVVAEARPARRLGEMVADAQQPGRARAAIRPGDSEPRQPESRAQGGAAKPDAAGLPHRRGPGAGSDPSDEEQPVDLAAASDRGAQSQLGKIRPHADAAGAQADSDAAGSAIAVEAPGANLRKPEDPVVSLFDRREADTAPIGTIDRGVTFDGDGARFSVDSEFALPVADALTGDSGSIAFWMQPDDTVDPETRASLVQLRSHYVYENRLQLWQLGSNINVVLADETGTEYGVGYRTESLWEANQPRHVGIVWGDNQVELYVNGTLVDSKAYDGSFKILPDTLLHIGSGYPEDPSGVTGTISRVKVYDRALAQDEVVGLSSDIPAGRR